MVEGELTGGVGEHELAGIVYIFAVAVLGERCGSVTCPFEICAVAAAPFPGVVEIEHGFHVALLEFGKEVVESFKEGIVVDAGGCLEHRLYVRFKSFGTIAADEHAEVGETQLLEEVEFACEALAVAILLGAEYGAVPEVCADETVEGVADVEFAVAHGDELWCIGLCITP